MNTKTSAESPNGDYSGAKIPASGPGKNSAGEFGREGTNKTIPEPKADNAPSEELGNTPHIEKTPYTRG
jgi:hypothetical protein